MATGAAVPPGGGFVRPPAQPQRYAAPPETSGKALGSLICGILFFFFPAAIVAIILGHLSLSDIGKSAGRLTGRGLAIAGLVLGYLGVSIIPLLIIAAIAIPNLLRARMAANKASAVGSLRTIYTAEETYVSTYANGYAANLDVLGGSSTGTADCTQAQLIDATLAAGLRSGYRFTYAPAFGDYQAHSRVSPEAASKGCTFSGASGYTVNADPVVRGNTGRRSFYTDQSGIIRCQMYGEASADSTPLK